jgi:3-deoxy-D-manno-octulosonate 8-phosphate phosphatase (KDO 8-P phosphatase)
MSDDIRSKAQDIRMLILDVDGVLTDGRMYYGTWDTPAAAFNSYDGAGLKFLLRQGIRVGLLTGRASQGVTHRAAVLGIEDVVQDAKIKLPLYKQMRDRHGLTDGQIAYMGDDLPDIPVLLQVGLSIAPPNAVPEVLKTVDLVTNRAGGDGAVREVIELLLRAQDKWDNILARYFDRQGEPAAPPPPDSIPSP